MLLFNWDNLLLLDARSDMTPILTVSWDNYSRVETLSFGFCIHNVILRLIPLSYLYHNFVNNLIADFYYCCWVLTCLASRLGAITAFGEILGRDTL